MIRKLNKKLSILGGLYVNKSIVSFPRFKDFNLKNGASLFEANPFNNRTWLWKIQQLALIPKILSYHYYQGDKSALIKLEELILNWVHYSNSIQSEMNSFLWHDHGTALRLNNLVLSFCYLNSKKISNSNLNKVLEEQILLHIEKLNNIDFYSINTNHGFDQSLFMYQACLEFEHMLGVGSFIDTAEKRIFNEIEFVFCEDGGHKENSVSYLNFGIKQCLMAYSIATSYNRNNGNINKIKDVINKATKVLYYAVKPNGYLPCIGDTAKFKVVDIFSNNNSFPEYSNFLYVISGGKLGAIPKNNFLILENSGYAFYKSTWEDKYMSDAIYLSFKAGYLSNYHRHDDDLSITLFGYGEDWLVDGGIYKYEEKNINRRYIRSSNSHNIISPDNIKASRDTNNKHEVYIRSLGEHSNSCFHVQGYSEMFPNHSIYRDISIDSDQVITILDRCSGHGELNATSRLFFYKDKKISIIDNCIYIYGKNKLLVIEVSSEHLFKIEKINSSDEKVVGKLSESINELYQANLIEISCCSFDTVSIKMKLFFKNLS